MISGRDLTGGRQKEGRVEEVCVVCVYVTTMGVWWEFAEKRVRDQVKNHWGKVTNRFYANFFFVFIFSEVG